jgi:hypothetical protein
VLLGASNLTRGIATVLETARRLWGRPLDVQAALGHGRSYGRPSSVFFRELPGILESGLWRALSASQDIPTAALVTDIGNDLLYEEPVEQIAQWIDECLTRLKALDARIAITLLPIENLPTLSPRRFEFFRRLYVPRCRLSLSAVVERVHQLNALVAELAARHDIAGVPQNGRWYGLDPMHITLASRRHAWREIMASWCDDAELPPPAPWSLAYGAYLQTLRPERRRVWGAERYAPQPAAVLRDGTTISLY